MSSEEIAENEGDESEEEYPASKESSESNLEDADENSEDSSNKSVKKVSFDGDLTLETDATRTTFSETVKVQAQNTLDELNDEALVKAVEELQKETRHLKIENIIFYRFLQKNDPDFAESMGIVSSEAKKEHDRVSMATRRSSLLSRLPFRRLSHIEHTYSSHAEKEGPKINITQKTDLVQKEIESIQIELEHFLKRARNKRFHLVSRLEEIEIRKSELEELVENFQKLKQSYEGQYVPFDKFVRFMDETTKKSRLLVDKIRLRYSSLKVQYQKLSTILAQKQLIGENLQEIDFEQLRIENLRLVEKIEKQNELLLELKNITGSGNLKLSQHKEILQQKIAQKEKLQKAIEMKENDIVKCDQEIVKLCAELDVVKIGYYKIKNRVNEYTAPEVIDYIRKKAELDNLKKDLKIWSRRKNMKELALAATFYEMKRVTETRQIDSEWLT